MGSTDGSLNVMDELKKAGAVLLNRHFVYKSGKHGSGYINMDPIYTNPMLMLDFANQLLLPFKFEVFDTVAAPAVGGVALVTYVGVESLGEGSRRIVWADKDGGDFHFERAGFIEQLQGKRVLVVEDLVTTGGSVLKVCREAEQQSAEIIGVSVICNRGGVTAEDLDVPRLEALAKVDFEAVDAFDCELCRQKVPVVADIGHGAAYQREHPDYNGGYIKLMGPPPIH